MSPQKEKQAIFFFSQSASGCLKGDWMVLSAMKGHFGSASSRIPTCDPMTPKSGALNHSDATTLLGKSEENVGRFGI